jgi:hypothetical protein
MEASELRRALKILAPHERTARGHTAEYLRSTLVQASVRCLGLIEIETSSQRRRSDMLLALESRTRERESPNIGLEQLER